ncbi:MAG: tetratricopeptide repeat protein [Proteobacteria bacterium]|nr:MAG: tetratricopeptide repeat protein [Pseudomonadota bacterium]
MVKRAMQSAQFKVNFISALSDVTRAIADLKPDLFIHDWGAQNESQARQFHIKFGQSTSAIDLGRIILVPEVTPLFIAFASDAMVERFQSYSSVPLTLANEITMMLESREASELQKFLRETKLNSYRYNQKDIDLRVEALFVRYPHDPKVKLEFANLQLRQGHLGRALSLSQELLNREPMNLRALNLLARARMKMGDWDDALQSLSRANSLSPQNPTRLMMIGDALFGKGDMESALTHYQQAMNLDADLVKDAGRQVGLIKLHQGELEEAVMFFKSTVSEDEAAGFFNNAAVQAARLERYEDALKLYQSALQTLKTDRLKPLIYYNIALSHSRLKAVDEAIKAVKTVLHHDTHHAKALSLLEKLKGQKAS